MPFVHLHVHSQYSLLKGAIHLDALIKKVKQLEMPAVAMTDSHNLFGAVDFYNTCKKAGIKPIIGCEIEYIPEGRKNLLSSPPSHASHGMHAIKSFKPSSHHLVLLCKNMRGYQNLCQMLTRSFTENPPIEKGQPHGPRAFVDRQLLDKYGDDLIVLSGCIRGEIPYLILTGEEEKGIEALHWFKQRFGDDFYLELQDTPLPEQENVNTVLSQWGERYNVQCVATTDCHYLEAKDAEAHEILQCIEHGKNLDFDRPKSLVPSEYYFKTAQEMKARFEQFPQAYENTLKIADKCNLEFKFKDDNGKAIYHLPQFRPDHVAKDVEFDLVDFFRKEAQKGLEVRFTELAFKEKILLPDWPELKKKYEARLEDELVMIGRTGFSGYFLIVADFINWAKRNKIPVGPGRGSGAGSLVAYSLKITDIDPIQFKLLFERFINPERVSMPDFDVDFCQDRRNEVIEYVEKKYGVENVSQIITFGKLQARAVIKDVGRVLGLSFAEMDVITKLLPDELDITISRALEVEPRLTERMENDSRIRKIIEYALSLEGLYRNAGIHAAGVIITEKPIVTYCPLYMGKDGDLVTQFDKDFSEAIGLIKFDFLGLKTLTVIDHAVQLIQQTAEPETSEKDFSIEKIFYNDPLVFALISSGDTDGIFQVESSGMKDLCSRIVPNSLEDLTAINALYRPGPLGSGMVDDFIDRKHGRKPIVYDLPLLESILKDTYGVILYQEQVMQIARELAGYSLGQADLLRRAMGKKKVEEMAEHREIFTQGAKKQGVDPHKAESIFDLMAKFAEYGFNKSHSAAYGVLTYQTAYLKAHYPAEFMAALMTTEMDNTEKITKYISNARWNEIPILPPDVHYSQKKFSVEKIPSSENQIFKKGIRFGLEAIKGVGGIAVETILDARTQGNFLNILDFSKRVSTRKVNKKVMESLCLSGALDSISEVNRPTLFNSLENLLAYAGEEQEEKELGQSSLFDSFSAEEIQLVTPIDSIFRAEPDWPSAKKLAQEKEVVGFYVSGHPMENWQQIFDQWLGWNTEKIDDKAKEAASQKSQKKQPQEHSWENGRNGRFRAPKTEIKIGGILGELKEVTTKKGTRMAFAQLEDLRGKIEILFFPDSYAQLQDLIKKALAESEVVIIGGEIEFGEEAPKLLAKTLEWATEANKNRVQQIVIHLIPSEVTPDQLRALKKQLLQNRGKCPIRIYFSDPQFSTHLDLPKTLGLANNPQSIGAINSIFGKDVVRLQSL